MGAVGGYYNSIGVVLVLFILLVIISRALTY
ncbi:MULTISPECIES: sporulation protein YjcZ [Paenibacillus]|uniref:Sporulation protein YjcZ n=2 Tax=Paenibacillus TaxID=44249 RepID=A0A559IYD6_9BACL|nr:MULTISPECIES: sporulation protein YjcZ [Paenibacillus]MBD8498701.1 sporulation protein YjcZ [Paenibacillus arenosi]TVX92601.1 sporulation protein YjcZ [Paenibacillus agilis]